MKYIAIEFMGRTEITGYVFICMEDGKEVGRDHYVDDSDSVRISRQLSSALVNKAKYSLFENGRLVIDKAFCVFDLEVLQYMVSINQRIKMTLLNPLLLYYCNNESLPEMRMLTKLKGVEGIIDIVERYYNR